MHCLLIDVRTDGDDRQPVYQFSNQGGMTVSSADTQQQQQADKGWHLGSIFSSPSRGDISSSSPSPAPLSSSSSPSAGAAGGGTMIPELMAGGVDVLPPCDVNEV